MAGLVASAMLAGASGTAASSGSSSFPWFAGVAAPAVGVPIDQPLSLALRYVSFWRYTEGFAWMQYNTMRYVLQGVPAVYAARPVTPPPGPAEPVTPPVPSQPVAAETKPAPAPRPQPVPGPVPSPEPAPQPAPKPQPVPSPQPAPEPAPRPTPKPQPVPSPQPEPAPEPEPDTPATPPRPAPTPKPEPEPQPEPAPQPAPQGLTDDERLMVQLVNAERAKAGLAPLEVDMRVVQTARIKSQDMITYNYFSHDSPRLGSPFDLMKSAGIQYRTAGENIAGNQTVEAAHRALMNSSGHRANILNRSFKKIGIGIIKGGRYGLMVTQQFIG